MSKRFGKARVCDYDAPGGPCTHIYTCGACLADCPVYFWTCEDGSAIADGPLQGIGTTTPREDLNS